MAEAAAPGLAELPDDALLQVFSKLDAGELPSVRLVNQRFKALVDTALSPQLKICTACHLGGRLSGSPVYGSQLEFTETACKVMQQRAGGLRHLELDYDAYGCCFASRLLGQQPLPQLTSVVLLNAEAQHVAALRLLPRLRDVTLTRHINGPVTAGPAAELLVAQLAGLPLRHLRLAVYRMLPGVLCSIADALPGLQQLALEVETVEQHRRLELAGLVGLTALESWELRLMGSRASAAGVTVALLPPGATALGRLSSVMLAHVRAEADAEDAFWDSLALLPGLRQLRYEESGHATRQPPAALLSLSTLHALHIKIDGTVYRHDRGSWTQLPELPGGALPQLGSLRLDCAGLRSLPASWCKLPLRELHISGLACEHSSYVLLLPEELPLLAGTLRRLELPSCGLVALPEQVAQLTGLTYLSLARNSILRLPSLSLLKQLEELDVVGNPASNAATVLQGCHALRRLGLGMHHFACRRESGHQLDAAYEDAEACLWQDAWLRGVQAALPWVTEIGVTYSAHYD